MTLKSYTKDQIEQKIHQIIDATPMLLSFVDQNYHYVFVNERYELVFGKKREEIEGRHIIDLLGKEIFEYSKPLYDRALKGEAVGHEVSIKSRENKIVRLDVNFVPLYEGNSIPGMVVTAKDITERWAREMDQELLGNLSTIYSQNLEEHKIISMALGLLKRRLDCTAVWLGEIFIEDESASVIYEDNIGTPLVGRRIPLKDYGAELSQSYLNGDLVKVSDVEKDPLTKNNLAAFSPLKVRSFFTIPLKRKGQLKAIICGAKNEPYEWSKQEVVLAQSVSETLWSNIEICRLLRELKESLRSRDEFISICSHELKTPISSLKLMYEMAERELKSGDPRLYTESVMRKRILISNTQIDRMSKLIDEMLEVSRISAGHLKIIFKPVDLREAATNVLYSFQDQLDELGIKVSIYAPQPVIISADQFRIEQVITNLLTNAMKYGNSLPVKIEILKTTNTGILKMKDQGIGMDKENFKRIFHRFERAVNAKDVSGLGLGLYITSQIVEAHKGTIHVESEPGKGSEFIVEFPLMRN